MIGSPSDADDDIIFNRSHRNQNEIALLLETLETKIINDHEPGHKHMNSNNNKKVNFFHSMISR